MVSRIKNGVPSSYSSIHSDSSTKISRSIRGCIAAKVNVWNQITEITVKLELRLCTKIWFQLTGTVCASSWQIWDIVFMSMGRHQAELTLTFDPWTPKSNQFIQFESKWVFAAKLKKFPEGIPEILQTFRKHNKTWKLQPQFPCLQKMPHCMSVNNYLFWFSYLPFWKFSHFCSVKHLVDVTTIQ